MPTAREALLDAAREAVERRPWPVVRMVEIAAAAGVSRQTLYNEFGDKAGLGTALMERQLTRFLDGFATRLAGSAASPEETLAHAADWILLTARRDRMVRAVLTGCHGTELPPCAARPGELVAELTGRAIDALSTGVDDAAMAARCETTVRLALSHVVAPAPGAQAASPTRGPAGAPAPGAQAPARQRRRAQPRAGQSPSWRSRVASSRRSE